jgi:antitoxin HicB
MMEYSYTVLIKPAEEGGFLAIVPALNGATTQGETIEEAREMARDLIKGYIESLLKAGQPLPSEEGGRYQGERLSVRLEVTVS